MKQEQLVLGFTFIGLAPKIWARQNKEQNCQAFDPDPLYGFVGKY